MPDLGSSQGDTEPPEKDHDEVVEAEFVDQDSPPPRGRFVAGEVIEVATFRQAPYPTPEDLAKYEEIHPGFTDRILTLTERETAHRIEREAKQDDATIALATRGQILAFIVVMTLVGGAIAAILTGHSIVGFAGLIIAAATLAGTFIAPRVFAQRRLQPPSPGAEIEVRSDEETPDDDDDHEG